ncbi:hypothetical protein D9M72_535810 [compost metagenome]
MAVPFILSPSTPNFEVCGANSQILGQREDLMICMKYCLPDIVRPPRAGLMRIRLRRSSGLCACSRGGTSCALERLPTLMARTERSSLLYRSTVNWNLVISSSGPSSANGREMGWFWPK